HALLANLLKPDRRPVLKHPVVIAPWSHYWSGYFDYLLFVVGKLARMKTVLTPTLFAEAIVTYPLLHSSFEAELLSLLGINADRLVDSRTQAIQFDRCILANNSSWFYPSAADVMALKSIVESQIPPPESAPTRRIYISRKGRRQVTNEDALTAMLIQYGFDIIEDKPRSITEQIELYQSASFIVGPHGASFANILWCQPGTLLLELFAPNYRPEYFRYLTHVLNLRHAAYCLGPVAESHYTFVDADMEVSVAEVERGITQLLTA
ncbi:MAG: glycosyltransferase family 61 protein, partial [Cytophagaceae bacterium]